MNVTDTGQLATILCAMVDIERREISVTSAGHLPPLLISNGDGPYLQSEIGLPIGVEAGTAYASTTVLAPHAATLVAFTDGLVEQRGEDLDVGLARLRQAATGNDAALPELLNKLVTELRGGPSEDDVAIMWDFDGRARRTHHSADQLQRQFNGGGSVVVRIAGELDISSIDALEERIKPDAHGPACSAGRRCQ